VAVLHRRLVPRLLQRREEPREEAVERRRIAGLVVHAVERARAAVADLLLDLMRGAVELCDPVDAEVGIRTRVARVDPQDLPILHLLLPGDLGEQAVGHGYERAGGVLRLVEDLTHDRRLRADRERTEIPLRVLREVARESASDARVERA